MVDSAASEEAMSWQWVAECAERYRASLAERPVAARADSQAIARKLSELEPLRQQGIPALECIQELVALAEPGTFTATGATSSNRLPSV